MIYECHVWYGEQSKDPQVYHCRTQYAVGDVMDDFLAYDWYRMDIYTDGKRSHVVRKVNDDMDPAILELK